MNIFSNLTKCNLNEGTFILGQKGSGGCSEGTQIADEKTCREACTFLNFPLGQILGNYKCYKDGQGNCYQNGRQGPGSSMICKASEKNSGRLKKRNKIPE